MTLLSQMSDMVLVFTLLDCLGFFYNLPHLSSGVPRNFVRGGGSTNSVEDRENGDLGVVAP